MSSPSETATCPEWCSSCGSSPEDNPTHFGNETVIPTSLLAPKEYRSEIHGVPTWDPSEVRVYMEQVPGAVAPVVRVTTGDLVEDELLVLDLDEARQLVAALAQLCKDGGHGRTDA
jgi:hypothetical protein